MIDTIRKYYDINSIFEYGCNTGRNLYYIKKEFPHYQVFGIDVNEDAIKTGIQKFNLPIKVGDKESLLEIPDDSFDLVFTISVIDHTITPDKICSELVRISRKHIVLLEPYFEREGKITKMQKLNSQETEDFFPFSYSWNYRRIFSHLNVEVVSEVPITLEGGFAGPYYRLYEFKKTSNFVPVSHTLSEQEQT